MTTKAGSIFVLVWALGSALTGSLLGQPAVEVKAADRPHVSATAAQSRLAAKPASQIDKAIASKPEKKFERAVSPDQVKKLLEDIKVSRAKFLQDQKTLQSKLKDATEDQRDQIRQELQDKRDQFLEQQKDLREEVLRRVNELKDQLKDHQDLIDSAKDQGKGKPHKGGP